MITLPFCLSFLARVINEHRAVQNLLLGMINSEQFKSRTIILYYLPWHVIYIIVNTCISIHFKCTYVYIHMYIITNIIIQIAYTCMYNLTYWQMYMYMCTYITHKYILIHTQIVMACWAIPIIAFPRVQTIYICLCHIGLHIIYV